MKSPEIQTISLKAPLEIDNLKTTDFKDEKFQEIFPLVVGDPVAYKKWSSDLANIINGTLDKKINISTENEDTSNPEISILESKIKRYLDAIVSTYEKGSFSDKVNVLNFINEEAFLSFSGFRDEVNLKLKDFYQKESGPNGNYFLYIFLSSFFEENLKKNENNEGGYSSLGYDLVSLDRYIHNDGNDLLISKNGAKEEVDFLLKKVNQIVKDKEWSKAGTPKQTEELFSYFQKLEEIFGKFTGEDISIVGTDKNISNKQAQDVLDYSIFLNEKVRVVFEKEFGVPLTAFSLPEQFGFIEYFKKSTNEDVFKNKEFAKQYGINGLRTFLSLEKGLEENSEGMGDKILELGNPKNLEPKIAEKVFSKYGEIIDTVGNIQSILDKMLVKETIECSQSEINEIKESLLIRAKNFLSTFYDKKGSNSVDLLKDLERYKTETLLYAETYNKLNQSGKKIKLEDIKNTEITILSQEEKEKVADKLWDVTKANRPFIEEVDKIQKRKKEFFNSIENKNSDFYVLKYKDNIIAFCSFTPDKDGNLCVESLNTESEIKGAQIGSEFFPIVLDKVKKQGKDIYGYVHAKNKDILLYYKRLGFVIKEVQKDDELKYEIRIPAQMDANLAA